MPNAAHRTAIAVLFALILSASCTRKEAAPPPDHPRLTPNVICRDITFRSAALNRDMQYRVILPAILPSAHKLPVVYLLHGGGGGFRDWSNYSDAARFAESGRLLVMPEAASSYYVNAVDPPEDRYEDYIVHDLISDVETRFPVATGRSNRAIVGLSMGGFGAVNLALRHPGIFAFVSGLSSAIDVPRRAFSWKRLQQSRHYDSIFGPSGSATRRANDPFIEAHSLLLPDLRGAGRPPARQPGLRRTPRQTRLSLRISHRPRRPRLEPMERLAPPALPMPRSASRPLTRCHPHPGPLGAPIPHQS